MLNPKLMVAACLLSISVCLFACAPNVAMKPDTAIAAEMVATPSPEASPSVVPTPVETAIQAPTPMAEVTPAAAARHPARRKSRPAQKKAEQPVQSKISTEQPGKAAEESRPGTASGIAGREEGPAKEDQPWLYWTPTPIAQASYPSPAGAATASTNQHSGWILLAAALAIAITAVLLTYRRTRMMLGRGKEENLSHSIEPQQSEELPITAKKNEPSTPAPAEPETRGVVQPAPVSQLPPTEPRPAMAEHKPVRRNRKPAAKSRTGKPAPKTSVARKTLKSETRKNAA